MTYNMLSVQINKKIAKRRSYEDLLVEVAKKTMNYLLMCYLQCEIYLEWLEKFSPAILMLQDVG